MNSDVLLCFGLLIPFSYILLYVLGGALRPGYSHISDSVSELLSPGSPNKALLSLIQVFYALLHILFGLGVVGFVGASVSTTAWGLVGAWMIVALGVATIGTVVFPQDPEGAPATTPGQIHKVLVFGVLIPASIASTLCIGVWTADSGILPGFDVYSYVTVGAIVVMGGVGGAAVKTRYAGLSERIAALVTHQWLFVATLLLLSR